MIEGLKLTMTGDELRKRLAERIKDHERLVAHYREEAKRKPDPKDEMDFVLPEHMCEYEIELHTWRAETLAYIREHIEGGEVYRLGAEDLEFGELPPEKPGLVAQDEYERDERVGFSLERIAKEMSRCDSGYAVAEAIAQLGEQREKRESGRKKKNVKPSARKGVAAS